VLQLATGVCPFGTLPSPVPFHPHDGLQQSQKRVVNPAVPVVGGTQAAVLVLVLLDELELRLLLLVDVEDELECVFDPDDVGVLVAVVDEPGDVPLGPVVLRLLEDPRVLVDEPLPSGPVVFEPDEPEPSSVVSAACPHAPTISEPNVKIAKL
jgi:hypothetical protein